MQSQTTIGCTITKKTSIFTETHACAPRLNWKFVQYLQCTGWPSFFFLFFLVDEMRYFPNDHVFATSWKEKTNPQGRTIRTVGRAIANKKSSFVVVIFCLFLSYHQLPTSRVRYDGCHVESEHSIYNSVNYCHNWVRVVD